MQRHTQAATRLSEPCISGSTTRAFKPACVIIALRLYTMSSQYMPRISAVVREVANLKVGELKHLKETFTQDVLDNLNKAYDYREARDTIVARLTILLDQIRIYDDHGFLDDEFTMWISRIGQAQNDKSITSEKLISIEKALHRKLAGIAHRLAMSEYYGALMNHAIRTLEDRPKIAPFPDRDASDDEFELIEEELERLCTDFETHAFSQKDIDVKAIEDYLTCLFDDSIGKKNLQILRQRMKEYGAGMLRGEDKLDTQLVEWCIKDLLDYSQLSAERQNSLRDILDSDAAIRELTGTLNSRSIRHWNWRTGKGGLPVSAQRNIDGKYDITIKEDLVDMIFLQGLAIQWGKELKSALRDSASARVEYTAHTSDELQKREYYLGPLPPPQPCSHAPCHPFGPPDCVSCAPMHAPPVPHAPSIPPSPPMPPFPSSSMPLPQPCGNPSFMRNRRRAKARRFSPSYPPSTCIDDERHTFYMRNLFLCTLPEYTTRLAISPNLGDQGNLLQMLSLDIKAREAFDGSVHGLRAKFQSFASSLPHETIITVLRYIGVPEQWLGFFQRFLSATLDLSRIAPGTSAHTQTRKCGLPVGHRFETFFGEAILFCLDLAVHHRVPSGQTTPYLLRRHDDGYFVGKQQQCEEVRQQIDIFANVMGLDVSVRDLFPPASGPTSTIGLLSFSRKGVTDSESPAGVDISLDDASVMAYARDLKMQLAACPNVFSWVSTWNRTIGTYVPHLFGPVANVLGKAHFQAVKRAYSMMYDTIFDDGNLTRHVAGMLLPLPSEDISFSRDAFIHLPAMCGGLGVSNSYAYVNSIGSGMTIDSHGHWKKYLEHEKKYYEKAREVFNQYTDEQRDQKLSGIFGDDKGRIEAVFGAGWAKATASFPTMEELTSHRERAALPLLSQYHPPPGPCHHSPVSCHYPYGFPAWYPLELHSSALNTYQLLASTPPPPYWILSDKIQNRKSRLERKLRLGPELTGQAQWALGLYGDECFESFDGLEIWYREGVPLELLKALTWEKDNAELECGPWYDDMTEA